MLHSPRDISAFSGRILFTRKGVLVLRTAKTFSVFLLFVAALTAAAPSLMAQQQTTGTPCSPAATTTVDGIIGKIDKLPIKLGTEQLTGDDQNAKRQAIANAND
jgi:hypothetical protein